jgi:thioredoxin-like negative regulator of GroEL
VRIRSLSIWWVGAFALVATALAFAIWWFRLQAAAREAQIDAHLLKAQQAAAHSQWETAAAELRDLLRVDVESHGAWLMLADVEFRQGHLDEALRCVARVPSGSANGALARQLEGTMLLAAGRGSRAETALKECIRLDPRAVEARRRLVFLYAVELRRDELRNVLWELDELGAMTISDLVLLSGSAFIVWNATETLTWIEQFVASDARDVHARIAAGRYRLRKNDQAGARAILEEAWSLEPTNSNALAGLIECHIDQAELESARRLLERVPAGGRDDARFAYLHGRLAEDAERWDEATEIYARAAAGDPDHREAHYRLGQLLLQTGDAAKAEPYVERARKLADRESLLGSLVNSDDPGHFVPLMARLEAELAHDRIAKAWYAEAVRLDPSNDELRIEAERISKRTRSRSE